jgi:hypothetical protein
LQRKPKERTGGNNTVADAVTIAAALGSALSTVWGYYVTVLVGLAAAIGALAASETHIDNKVKIVITLAIVMFAAINFISLYHLISELNPMIEYIATHNTEFGKIVSTMSFSYWTLVVQPAGVILLLVWLWLY